MLDKVIDLADRIWIIDGVIGVLIRQPDKANAKLAEVLEELAKTFAALDEMVRYTLPFRRKHKARAWCAFGHGGRTVGHPHQRGARPLPQDQEHLRRLSRQVV